MIENADSSFNRMRHSIQNYQLHCLTAAGSKQARHPFYDL